jgi:hypothetical protein
MYDSPRNTRVIKLNMMRWEGHVARMGEMTCIQNFDR